MTAAADEKAAAAADAGRRAPPPSSPAAAPRSPTQIVWFVRVLVALARREMATVAGYRISFLLRGFSFAISVVALGFLSSMVRAAANPHLAQYGGDYLAFAFVGLVVMEFQQVAVLNLSQRIRNSQIMGLLEAELATPAPPWIVLGVGPAYEMLLAAGRSILYCLLVVVAFGVGFPRLAWGTLLLAVPLVLGAFSGIGLLAAATTMLARRTNPVGVLLGSASLLLSGVVYPISVLPRGLQMLGQVLPATHALELVRGALLRGASPAAMARSIVALGLFAGLLIPIGAGLFVYALRRARVDGSLTHY